MRQSLGVKWGPFSDSDPGTYWGRGLPRRTLLTTGRLFLHPDVLLVALTHGVVPCYYRVLKPLGEVRRAAAQSCGLTIHGPDRSRAYVELHARATFSWYCICLLASASLALLFGGLLGSCSPDMYMHARGHGQLGGAASLLVRNRGSRCQIGTAAVMQPVELYDTGQLTIQPLQSTKQLAIEHIPCDHTHVKRELANRLVVRRLYKERGYNIQTPDISMRHYTTAVQPASTLCPSGHILS